MFVLIPPLPENQIDVGTITHTVTPPRTQNNFGIVLVGIGRLYNFFFRIDFFDVPLLDEIYN